MSNLLPAYCCRVPMLSSLLLDLSICQASRPSCSGVFHVGRNVPIEQSRCDGRGACRIAVTAHRHHHITTDILSTHLARSRVRQPSTRHERHIVLVSHIISSLISFVSAGLSTVSRPGAAYCLVMITTTLSGLPVCIVSFDQTASARILTP